MRLALVALLPITLLTACGGGSPPPAPPRVPTFTAQAGYPRIRDEILDWYLARNPVHATMVGEHAYDTTLGAYFPGDLERARHDARALLTRLEDVNRATLARDDGLDYRLLEYALRAELLDLEEIDGWQRDPARYVALIEDGLLYLSLARDLPADVASNALAARMRAVPLLLRAARQNLDAARVPPLYARRAIENARVLPWGVLHPRGYATGSEADQARAVASASLDSFALWLENDLLPRAQGDFRLGADRLAQVLRYEHHIDVPLDQLDRINRRATTEYREWLDRVALELDPLAHPEDLADGDPAAFATSFDLPDPDSRVRRALGDLIAYMAAAGAQDLVALESEGAPADEQFDAIRRALHAHALLHAMLQIHAAGATIDAAAEEIANIGLESRDGARMFAENIAYDPEAALDAIERMRLFALREQLRDDDAAHDDAAFLEAIAASGLPVTLAAESLLGHEPGALLVEGRRTPGVPEPPRIGD